MRPAVTANLGIAAFLGILAISLWMLIAGSAHPRLADVVQVGQSVPELVLSDARGEPQELSAGSHFIMLVYSPTPSLTPEQVQSLHQMSSVLAERVPLQAVVVMPGHQAMHLPGAIETQQLTDDLHQLWALTGMNPTQASVCVIDPRGVLRFRSEVPPRDLPDLAMDLSQSALAALPTGRVR